MSKNQLAEAGFIGLGLMGSAMAERLIESGYKLHIHDPDSEAAAVFARLGAQVHASPKELSDHAEIVFACLPSAEVSEAVAEKVSQGSMVKVLVEMSTIGRPAVEAIAKRLAVKMISVIDAPISGGPKGARAGRLSVMVAGDPETVSIVMPLLETIGSQVFVIDERPGRAQVMKLVNNLISAAVMASTYEAIVVGAKAGLDPDLMLDVLNASSARNSATLQKVPASILTGTFDFGASVRTITKDVMLGLAEARTLGVPMWTGESVGQLWRFAESQGAADEDYTTLIKFIEGWAGTTVRGRAYYETNDKKDVEAAF